MDADDPTTPDLRMLVEHPGPFLTALIPARSDVFGAAERFTTQANNALRDAPDSWDADVATMEQEISELAHGDGAALIAIRPSGGPSFYEFVDDAVHGPSLSVGPLPRLAPLLEARQRTVAHVVVETDLAGATITAFDGGDVTVREEVEGDTDVIHRGHPGGWSQRRFQQRAENSWEENAKDVADTVRSISADVDARIVLVAGPTRASSMLVSLLDELDVPASPIEAGDADGVASEVVRLVADVVASDTAAVLSEIGERFDTRATSGAHVESSLDEGRVKTLLVHDDADDEDTGPGPASDTRLLDRCIAKALTTDAEIRIVPRVALLDQGVAAILRW